MIRLSHNYYSTNNYPIQILHVDDDVDDAFLIQEELAGTGNIEFSVKSVGCMSKAFDFLAESHVNLVLLDLNLPDSQGIQTVTRFMENYPEMPVVVLTSLYDRALSQQILQAGAQDYLVKGQTNRDLLIHAIDFAIKRQNAWRAPEESEAQLRSLISSIADGLIVVAQDGSISFANPAAEDLFGRPASSLVGTLFGFPILDQETFLLEIIHSKGKIISADMRLAQINWKGDPAYLVSLRDISERKRWEDDLMVAKERLEERTAELQAANLSLQQAAQLKNDFLANMSHELRTPLTGILGFTDILILQNHGLLNEQQFGYLKHIKTSGQRLLQLINDILDFSNLQSGKFELQMGVCNLMDVIQSSLSKTKEMADKKHQKIQYSMSPASIFLLADGKRMKQIIVNLLSNAIKFTPDGGKLGIEVIGNTSEQMVDITVWDTGIGIKDEDFARMFQSFMQLDASLQRKYNGSGLGLALVKSLVELHGGTVQVTSTPGQGSRFTVRLIWAAKSFNTLWVETS